MKVHVKGSLNGHFVPVLLIRIFLIFTCPSCGTSAFSLSLLGSESLVGATWTVPGAFFSSSAKSNKKEC